MFILVSFDEGSVRVAPRTSLKIVRIKERSIQPNRARAPSFFRRLYHIQKKNKIKRYFFAGEGAYRPGAETAAAMTAAPRPEPSRIGARVILAARPP
jgi:hypothetical protein